MKSDNRENFHFVVKIFSCVSTHTKHTHARAHTDTHTQIKNVRSSENTNTIYAVAKATRVCDEYVMLALKSE